jgi:ABC-type lipoprotein release transport system permease subunit
MTFAAVAGLLGVVALVACALPAWRVMRVNPLKVLRVE